MKWFYQITVSISYPILRFSMIAAIIILLLLSSAIFICRKWDTVADVDGNIYHTVKIGDQVWMVENLRTTHFQNGEPLPNIQDNEEWKNLNMSAYCSYDNNPETAKIYGMLYNGYAVMDSRNLAPVGWHIAQDSDWAILTNCLGGLEAAGGKLKEKGFAHWLFLNPCSEKETGFLALPGGERATDGKFLLLGRDGFWWSPAENHNSHIIYRRMFYYDTIIERDDHPFTNGFSVRCVKN